MCTVARARGLERDAALDEQESDTVEDSKADAERDHGHAVAEALEQAGDEEREDCAADAGAGEHDAGGHATAFVKPFKEERCGGHVQGCKWLVSPWVVTVD